MNKAKLNFTRFFTGYFKNIHRILLTNILFAVPFAGFTILFYWLNGIVKPMFDMILFLSIIFIYPFYAGVTAVTRNIAREDENISVKKTFFPAIKENLKYFIIHGIVIYLVIFFSYASITLYWQMAQTNSVFLAAFVVVTVIMVLALFFSYSLPVMTVTFDLSLKNIYKNSFLMSFGELKNNFFATLGLFLLFLFCATIFITVPNMLVLLITMIVLALLVVPATASYIINFYILKDMMQMVADTDGSDFTEDKTPAVDPASLDFSELDLDENKDGEEYLFFNGKMIKRKTLIKMHAEQEKTDE